MKILRIMILCYLCLNLAGCTSWRFVKKSELSHTEKKQAVRIRLDDELIYETKDYAVVGDSLIFWTSQTPFFKGIRKSVLVDDVLTVEKMKLDPSETLAAIIPMALFLYLITQIRLISLGS